MFENPKIPAGILESNYHLFQVHDEYEEKMTLDLLTKHFPFFSRLYGAELNAAHFEEKFLTVDLFQENLFFVVLNAEKIPKGMQQFILDNWSKCSNHKILFIFKQETELLKSFKKLKEFNLFQIEQPAFFEFDRVLSYLLRKAGFHLDEETLTYVLDLIPAEMSKIWSFVQVLKIYFPLESGIKRLSKADIDPYISSEKLDQFYYSTLLSQKNLYKFYRELSNQNFEIELWRRTLPFFLSHLRKLLNPSYTKKKNKLSRYDKEIMACTKLWDEKSLFKEMKELSHLELTARIRPTELPLELRRRYLREII
jgi:hypothetical protein